MNQDMNASWTLSCSGVSHRVGKREDRERGRGEREGVSELSLPLVRLSLFLSLCSPLSSVSVSPTLLQPFSLSRSILLVSICSSSVSLPPCLPQLFRDILLPSSSRASPWKVVLGARL